jgi:hypothetical protein
MNRLAIAVLLATGASCKKKVDTADFEGRLQKRTEELGLTGAAVKCPKGVEAKVGQSFDCTVTVGGTDYVLVATVTKVDGKELGMDTRWKDGQAVIATKLAPPLGEELTAQFGVKTTIDCGKGVLAFLDKDRNVTCDITAGDVKAKVLVTFDDKLAPTDWRVEPPLVSKARLEKALTDPVRAKTSPTVTVTCGDKALVSRPADGKVECQLADGGKTAKLAVMVDDKLQIQSWEVVQ